jgi:hypothetical protein
MKRELSAKRGAAERFLPFSSLRQCLAKSMKRVVTVSPARSNPAKMRNKREVGMAARDLAASWEETADPERLLQ